jgi:hypothetical protein
MRAAERDHVRQATGLLQQTWPSLFWFAFIAVGVGLCFAGHWPQGVVILCLAALLVMRKGISGLFRRLTYDPWRE